MTQARSTQRRTRLEKNAAEVIGLLVSGETHANIARKYKVDDSAVTRFTQRHAAEITPLVAEVERQITDAAIADKVRRILDADADYQRLGQVIEARASDTRYTEPGYRTGLMVHQVKQIGAGKYAETVDEYKVDTAVIAERRALRREVAEELDQLPRTGNVNIDNRSVTYVREYHGLSPTEID